MTRNVRSAIILAGLALCAVGVCQGDEPESAVHRAEALQVTTTAAKAYEFELAGEEPGELAFHRKSILRWSNPVAGEIFGNVFVWTRRGRPEVIGSLHQWYSPHTHGSHEFHSLATSPIRGKRKAKPVWDAARPGIVLSRVPNQGEVAESSLARLQLRAISRQFTVQKTDRQEISRNLRLLAQPIYRYPENRNAGLRDGGLFVYVEGTDPEVFLLLESRQAKNKWEWQYAFARMNSVQFVARHSDRIVWSVETWPWSKTKNGTETYTHFGPFELAADSTE